MPTLTTPSKARCGARSELRGQRCTASSRLVVHKKVYKKFCEKLVEKVKKLKVGNGLDAKTEVGPVINQAAMDKILSYIEIGRKKTKRHSPAAEIV